jgi:hypothetical protein
LAVSTKAFTVASGTIPAVIRRRYVITSSRLSGMFASAISRLFGIHIAPPE